MKPLEYSFEKKTLKWVKEEYGGTELDSLDSGEPAYWAICRPRMKLGSGFDYTLPVIFEDSMVDYASLGSFLDYVFDEEDHISRGGIIIAPPPEEEVTIDIVGKFFSPNLGSDTDYSWWTENYDDILVMAALRKLEILTP